MARLTERVRALDVGVPTEGNPDMGPIVTGAQRDRIAGYIATGVKEGATLVVDGRTHPRAEGPGFFLGGTLFDRVTSAMSNVQENISQ